MRIHTFSDLHMDASSHGWVPEVAAGADLVVCAGDVCEGLPQAFKFLRAFFKEVPIVTVAGNHSFYRRSIPGEIAKGRQAARELDIHFLDDEEVVIGGVRFLGATLWTDYCLFGEGMQFTAMSAARLGMNDHRLITWQKQPWLRFRPQEALTLHNRSRVFLSEAMRVPHPGPTVVVTHHLPLPRSVPDKYADDVLNAAYASDLSTLVGERQPTLWIHGHTHTSCDYRAGDTRVVCNPHGYGLENVTGFETDLILEV